MGMLLTLGFAWSILNHFQEATLEVQCQVARTVSSGRLTCPLNTYSTDQGKCAVCSKCDPYSVERRPCTRRRDAVCLKCNGNDAIQRPACRKCPPCPEGQFVSVPCTRRNLTECRTCPQGSFNPKTSYSNVCSPCTSCYHQKRIVFTQCRNDRDTVCGDCKTGYYSKRGSSRCIPCRSCTTPRQRTVPKCLSDGTGRRCGQTNKLIYHHVVESEVAILKLPQPIDSLNIEVATFGETTTEPVPSGVTIVTIKLLIFFGLVFVLIFTIGISCYYYYYIAFLRRRTESAGCTEPIINHQTTKMRKCTSSQKVKSRINFPKYITKSETTLGHLRIIVDPAYCKSPGPF